MANQKISEMTAASSVADADLVPVVQGGVNKKATSILLVTAAKIATALGFTPANAAALNATALTSGTVPDARFPATLPAASGANLTALNASNIASGTVPDARFPATLPAVSGANLTNLDATDLTGTIDSARLPTVPTTKGGTGLTTIGTGLQVLRVNAGATALEYADAAGGGGYEKLTASGPQNGILTLYDDTAVTGETRFVIREGADLSGYEDLFQVQSVDGTVRIKIGGANNDFKTYLADGGIRDFNDRFYSVSSSGVVLPSDSRVSICSGTNTYSAKDVNYGRGGTRTALVSDENGAPCLLAVGSLGVANSAAATTPGTVTKKIEIFDASGASLGFIAVYDAIT